MALITCPECSHSVSDKAISCPNCGYPIKSSPATKQAQNMPGKAARRHPKLPNGFGSIKKLSGNRANPYSVHPPTKEFTQEGVPITPTALCYVNDWYTGFYALLEYRNGTFDAERFKQELIPEDEKDYNVVSRIIAAFNNNLRLSKKDMTFSDVYQLFYKAKFENPQKEFSRQSKNAYGSAFKNCSSLHEKPFSNIMKDEMQYVLDHCQLGYSSLRNILNLFGQMFQYAIENGIVEKDYSQFVEINQADNNERGEPFTESEIKLLWEHIDNPDAQIALILIYSGLRISELQVTSIDLEQKLFIGGLKTKSGKTRTVPIHNSILSFVEAFRQDKYNAGTWRDDHFYLLMEQLGISKTANGKKHTPHDCRHTFSWLADKYKMDELSKRLIMGHSIGRDVEKTIYGHRTLEELRTEVNKITAPNLSLTCR